MSSLVLTLATVVEKKINLEEHEAIKNGHLLIKDSQLFICVQKGKSWVPIKIVEFETLNIEIIGEGV